MEKQYVLLSWLYPKPPSNPAEALVKGLHFLNREEGNEEEEDDRPRVFSFEKDGNLIYAAFKQTHNIDLQTTKLHWYQFLALFDDLHQDTSFCQIRNLRYRIKTGKATKEERQAAFEMEDLLALPELDKRSYKERLREKRLMEKLNSV